MKSEYCQAYDIHTQILDKITAKGDTETQAFASLNIAEIEVTMGVAAAYNLEKATNMLQSIQHVTGLTCCETILADLNLRDGNTLIAKAQFEQCLRLMWKNDDQVVSYCLERLADTHQHSGALPTFIGAQGGQ